MKELKKNRNIVGNTFIIISLILMIIFGLILGYLSADLYSKLNGKVKSIDKSNEVVEVKETTNSGGVILNDGAIIEYNRVYVKCNELVTKQEVADNQYIGKNLEEIKEIFKEWEVLSFDTEKIVLQRNIESYSPNYYKIGVYDNGEGEEMVAVFTFDIDGQEMVETVTETPTGLLHEKDVEALINGIYTNDKDELNNMMQNYNE